MSQFEELIFRNVEATKKRGQIHSGTNIRNHIAKLKEEIKELEDSLKEDGSYDKLEAIDIFLVSATMLVYERLYPNLVEKVVINEQRAIDCKNDSK